MNVWIVLAIGFPALTLGGLAAFMGWESHRAARWLRNLP